MIDSLPVKPNESVRRCVDGTADRPDVLASLDPPAPHGGDPLELCALDAGTMVGEIVVRQEAGSRMGRAMLVARQGDPRPRWVLKSERVNGLSRWSPQREFRGLTFIDHRMADVPGFGVIKPIGYSDEARWLVMSYQAGTPLRGVFDRAICGIAGREMQRAIGFVGRLARWLRLFRQGPIQTELNPSTCIQFCVERMDEIHQAFGGIGMEVRSRLNPLIAELVGRIGSDLGLGFPTHGDMATQNFILARDTLYPIDLEEFAFKPLDEDFALFRFRFEADAIRRPWARARATRLWQIFCDAYAKDGREAFVLLAYLHKLLADLAWTGRRPSAGRSLVQSVRTRLRVSNRLRWLAGLPASFSDAYRYLRDRL